MTSYRPLEGVRVLDLSRLLPGPFASMILCDLGAEVDKVEDAAGGDYLRVTMPFLDDGMGAAYHVVNRGKRSVVIDVKKPEGRDAILKMLPRYDIVLEGNRPGVMKRLGLDYETMKAIHPGIIYCAITGYGQDGPMRDRAGHDINYIARAGVLGVTGPENGPPQLPGVQTADITGGMYAVIGILAALEGRRKSGQGTFVDISMSECALTLATVSLALAQGTWKLPRGGEPLTGGIAPFDTYTTKDGGAVTLGALEPKFWKAFCDAVGLEYTMDAMMPGKGQENWKSRVREIFLSRTRDEWIAFSKEVDCCLEPVLTPEEELADEHLNARGVFEKRTTHGTQSFTLWRTPVAAPAEGKAPKQGQDGEAVLRDAGFGDAEIAALREAGVTR